MAVNDPWSFGLVVLRIAQTAAAATVLGPLGAYLGVLLPIWGFAVFVIGGAVGLLNAVAGVVLLKRGERRRGIAAVVLSEAAGLTLVFSSVRGIGKPAINDISTDLAEPPLFVSAQTEPGNVGRDLVYPEPFKPIVQTAYPDVVTLRTDEPPDVTLGRAIAVVQAEKTWRLVSLNPTSRVIEGVATSRIFGFKDDFVIRVRPSGAGSIVDMRSKSRDGKGDLGANATRIRGFFEAFRSPHSWRPPAPPP